MKKLRKFIYGLLAKHYSGMALVYEITWEMNRLDFGEEHEKTVWALRKLEKYSAKEDKFEKKSLED